jgi:hypothetical protein
MVRRPWQKGVSLKAMKVAVKGGSLKVRATGSWDFRFVTVIFRPGEMNATEP